MSDDTYVIYGDCAVLIQLFRQRVFIIPDEGEPIILSREQWREIALGWERYLQEEQERLMA